MEGVGVHGEVVARSPSHSVHVVPDAARGLAVERGGQVSAAVEGPPLTRPLVAGMDVGANAAAEGVARAAEDEELVLRGDEAVGHALARRRGRVGQLLPLAR